MARKRYKTEGKAIFRGDCRYRWRCRCDCGETINDCEDCLLSGRMKEHALSAKPHEALIQSCPTTDEYTAFIDEVGEEWIDRYLQSNANADSVGRNV